MQLVTGADVVAEFFDQVFQRAAVAEAAPSPSPYRVMCEYALAAVVVDKPDLAARVQAMGGTEEEVEAARAAGAARSAEIQMLYPWPV
ncbi:hypothetical protein [Pseudomonas reinekei]